MNFFEKHEGRFERIVEFARQAATAVGDEEFAAECANLQDAMGARYGGNSERPASIACPMCGTQSWRQQHIEQKYCSKCHKWFALMDLEKKDRDDAYLRDILERETA